METGGLGNVVRRAGQFIAVFCVIFSLFWSCASKMDGGRSIAEAAKSMEGDNNSPAGDIAASARVRKLLDDLDAILAKGTEDQPVAVLMRKTRKYINNGQIQLRIFSESEISGDRGVFFQYDVNAASGKRKLTVSLSRERLVDYTKYQCSLLSDFVYSMKQLYDFINNPEAFSISMKNDLDRYILEMDALYYQAMFLKDYAIPQQLAMTDYGTFIYNSLREDNLSRASLYFKKADMNLLYSLYRQKVLFTNKQLALSEYLISLIQLGNEIIKQADFDSEWNIVMSVMKMYSYDYYLPYVINDFWADASPEEDSVYRKYADELNNIKVQMKTVNNEYKGYLTNFYAKIMEKYSKKHE